MSIKLDRITSNSASDIGLVILAAGASTRMGTPKQLLPYREKSLIRHVVEQAIASVCHPIIVVLGAHFERIKPELEFFNIPDFSRSMEKPTKDLTPQPPSVNKRLHPLPSPLIGGNEGGGKGVNSKPLSLQERGLERGFPHPVKSKLNIRVIENPDWAEGMSTSVRVGVEFLQAENPDVEAIVLMVCDQPFVSTRLINQLVENYRTGKGLIVASEYTGVLGVPALFDRSFFPELTALSGDVGARRVIQRHAQKTLAVPSPEGAFDLDTPVDYEQLQERSHPL